MYATIIQSAVSPQAVRQTVIIPDAGEARVYSRLGAGQRGTAGAWDTVSTYHAAQGFPGTSSSPIVGEPTSIRMTPSDMRAVTEGDFPATLLQKLVRAVKGQTEPSQTETGTEVEVIQRVLTEALDGGEAMVKYLRGPQTSRPQAVFEQVSERVVEVPLPTPQAVTESVAAEPVMSWTDLSVPMMDDPVVSTYVERTLDGGMTETDVYDFARSRSEAVAIVGPAGTGKTSSARAYAAKRGLPLVVFECNPQVDEEVVQGTYIPTGNGNELRWRYSALATALTQPSVILLNESNRMTARSNALFLALLQERELRVSRHKGEVLKVHPECLIIADSNDGYRGTQKSDQAFLDRFNVKVEFSYDRRVESEFIPSTALLDMAEQLRREAEREDAYRTPISTRLLKNFVAQAQGLSWEFAVASLLNNFELAERDALGMVVQTYSERIQQELGLVSSTANEQASTTSEDDLSVPDFSL